MADVLLNQMRDRAGALKNGHRGDIGYLCEVVADLAAVLCDIAEHGCQRKCGFGWPACAAVLGTVAMIAGVVLAAVA